MAYSKNKNNYTLYGGIAVAVIGAGLLFFTTKGKAIVAKVKTIFA